ncbi:MAG: sigma-70 family RNA polymerase sigma factor [Lentimicrobiaceae bacterium]|jgi:RNA polymerase sigma-70 factor (ECF subfamily)|nr:sigma-70 family RNA polymerase sigma factor [Lentimicrobiaceae bacterium]
MKYEDDNFYISKVVNGDVSSFAYLIEKHKDLVFTIAYKIVKNREDAEEISQDSFLKIFRSLSSFKGEAKFATWLYRIVYNTAISKTRKKALEWTVLDDTIINNFTEDEISINVDYLSDDEQFKFMNRAINELPDNESLLLTLFYKNNNTIEEIAEITGLSSSNVKVKLHRIRKKLYDSICEITQNKMTVY